jgi:asparagine synthase (glutamine-hydrolysing)
VDPAALARMAGALRHRGPDGYGFYADEHVGLAHVRLSIIDLACGQQPMSTADGRYVITYNGEVYNYIELKEELSRRKHRFRTSSDTEVILEAYAEWGADALGRLNGQFAFAILDRLTGELFLARDRFGVRPLFYAETTTGLVFGSEAKALFASGEIAPRPDFVGLDQVLTFWSALPPRTVFHGVNQLEPGSWARWSNGRLSTHRYYQLSFDPAAREPLAAVEELDELLEDSVRLRMRADVPVGGYLSGGLDSTITCALAAPRSPHQLRSFSVTFEDPALNEASFQEAVARRLGSLHLVEPVSRGAVAEAFADAVWHTETPLVRTAPTPLYLLARLTKRNGIKVVLTGEGSDELFWGYDLFKEVQVRLFCLRQPESTVRPRLFDRLYPYLGGVGKGGEFWRNFFLNAGTPDDPLFSHLPRFQLAAWTKSFYGGAARDAMAGHDVLAALRLSLPDRFSRWTPLARAAYLEMETLLSPYLLASQGDRMAMAHGVEGRFPFLDHRLFEFVARLPERSKLRGLREKDILRRWASRRVPRDVANRPKQPYRAPDVPAFFGEGRPEYVRERLTPEAIRSAGLFEPKAVEGLVRRCEAGRATGFRENQAFVAILSAQVWHDSFIAGRRTSQPLPLAGADVVAGRALPQVRQPSHAGSHS